MYNVNHLHVFIFKNIRDLFLSGFKTIFLSITHRYNNIPLAISGRLMQSEINDINTNMGIVPAASAWYREDLAPRLLREDRLDPQDPNGKIKENRWIR